MNSPGTDLDTSDPGDDVGLRFQYQYCYAAIIATRLVTHGEEVIAVICENHEDVLVERPSGTFDAIQVKTRDLDQKAFRATDTQVRKAVARFCVLNKKYPGSFESFSFVTNHQFWEAEKDAGNLPWIIDSIRERGHIKRLRKDNPLRGFVEKLCEITELDADSIVATIKKIRLTAKLDTVRSIRKDLQDAVAEIPGLNQQPYSCIMRIAASLRILTNDASTKGLKGQTSDLYSAESTFKEVMNNQLVSGKYIKKQDVENIIANELKAIESPEALNIAGLTTLDELPHGMEVMVKKMARGGVQSSRVQQMQDLVHSVQALYLRWARKDGSDAADERYEDLLARVKVECVEARISAEASGDPYGAAMYAELLDRLKSKCQAESDSLYGCKPEHLFGAAGILTQNCKAWWSTEFDLTGSV